MFCKNCGKEIDDNAYVCPHCGVKVASGQEVGTSAPKKVNGFGVAGFVVSLVSLISGLFFYTSIVGLILSIIGMRFKNRYTSCNGLAIAGLVLGILSLVIWVIIIGIVFGTSLIER